MRLLVLFLAMLALATSALAQQQQPPAKPAPRTAAQPAKPAPAKPPAPKSPFTPPAFKIIVATEGAYPPFNYLDRKGLPAGFEMELAQDACQRMKAECEFVVAKWDDLVPGLLDKKFDIVMSSLEVNSERRRRLGMSRRYYLSLSFCPSSWRWWRWLAGRCSSSNRRYSSSRRHPSRRRSLPHCRPSSRPPPAKPAVYPLAARLQDHV